MDCNDRPGSDEQSATKARATPSATAPGTRISPGGARDKLPIIAIGGQYGENFTPAHYGREMEEYRALGLAGCKFKVGGQSPAEDAARTAAARGAGGDDFILCVDANRGWPRATALEFARLTQSLKSALVRGTLPLEQ